jgi:O-antigen ligase
VTTITLVGLKSRATLLGIPVVLIWMIIHAKMNKKLRYTIIVLLVAVIILLYIRPDFYNILLKDVIFAGRNATDMSELSSGRSDEWADFWSDFSDRPFWGHGKMKRESIILTALLEFGILGGLPILIIAVWPFAWAVKYIRFNKYYVMFSSVAIAYLVNGVFEQLAPFGPGVKCYFLWFVLGILATHSANTDLNKVERNIE